VNDRPLSERLVAALDRAARRVPLGWKSSDSASGRILRSSYRTVRRLLGSSPTPDFGRPSASLLPGESPPTISYAQNAEDVVLSRAFATAENGFYVDVGAADPRAESVTKLFYDRGWHGINVEPQRRLFEALQVARPRDINLNLAVSDTTGSLAFYGVPARPGRSTLTSRLAEFYRSAGYEIEETTVTAVTLREICEKHAPSRFEFLKIDVEGHEEAVLRGADWEAFRPAVVVVEATDSEAWEHILQEARYSEVLFDGVNRFYLADECPHLRNQLKAPASVIDSYVPYVYHDQLAAAGETIRALTGRVKKLEARLSARRRGDRS
jgi:FkbM family methyltransferase